MEYMMKLRIHLSHKYPDHLVSGSIYQGYMDMTYFSFTPESLKKRKLKVALVFIHEKARFEVWLAASNRQVQKEYLRMINVACWERYKVSEMNPDSIVEHVLADNPDFDDLDALTIVLENGLLDFLKEVCNLIN